MQNSEFYRLVGLLSRPFEFPTLASPDGCVDRPGRETRVHPPPPLPRPVTEDSQTGPWVLVLGALAIGVGAVATELLRYRRNRPGKRERDDGA